MAEGKLHLQVVAAFGRVLDTECDEVNAPGAAGRFGVLPGHIPFLTAFPGGVLWYRAGGATKYVALASGHAEVHADRVLVLADTAEEAEKIDLERAKARLAELTAEAGALSGGRIDDPRLVRAKRRIVRESARVEAAGAAARQAH